MVHLIHLICLSIYLSALLKSASMYEIGLNVQLYIEADKFYAQYFEAKSASMYGIGLNAQLHIEAQPIGELYIEADSVH